MLFAQMVLGVLAVVSVSIVKPGTWPWWLLLLGTSASVAYAMPQGVGARSRLARWIGLIGRGVFWVGLFLIVTDSVLASYLGGDWVMAVLKVVFFPFTYLWHPWGNGLLWLLLASWAGYILSTVVGRLPALE